MNAGTIIPTTSASKKSICICISGQMRLYEKVFAEIKSQFQDWDVTFIVSVWRQRGGKILGALNPQQCHRMFPAEVALMIPPTCLYDKFYITMPNIQLAITDQIERRGLINENMIRNYFPDAIVDIEDDIVVSGQVAKLAGSEPANSYRMFYKIARANRIKAELEGVRGKKFDVVIRTRPDRPLSTLQIPEDIFSDQNLLYLDWFQPSGPYAGDQVAIGSSVSLDAYAMLFSVFDARMQFGAETSDWKGTHKELAEHLISKKIKIRPIMPILPVVNEEYLNAEEFLAILRIDEERSLEPVKSQLIHFRASIEGSVFLAKGDLQNALLKSREAISAHTSLPGAWFLKAQVLRKKQEFSESFDAAMQALRYTGWARAEYPFISDFVFEIVNEVNLDQGLQIAQNHFELSENIALLHTVIGILKVRGQSYSAAKDSFNTALQHDPGYYRAAQKLEAIKSLAIDTNLRSF